MRIEAEAAVERSRDSSSPFGSAQGRLSLCSGDQTDT